MTNLDSVLKSRDITLPTKVGLVKVMVFPVVTYGCESWIVKKAEHRSVMPRVRVPKTERIRCPQQCKSMKGFYFQLELGFPPHPTQRSGARSPEPRFTAVFIGFRTESWQGLISCRSFLVFTNWLIFIGCGGFLVFTNWLLAAGGCLLRPDKVKPGYREYADQTSPGIRGDDLTGQ